MAFPRGSRVVDWRRLTDTALSCGCVSNGDYGARPETSPTVVGTALDRVTRIVRRGGTCCSPTSRQSAGPFYPAELPLDDDNDLTRISGSETTALGRVTDLSGRLLDVDGMPIRGMRMEIWQCDANGRYRHPFDRGGKEPDPNFQGHGALYTDELGRYRFRTIRPVAYPGRTPHIHLAVFPEGVRPFTTQIYIDGDSRNAGDGLYRRLSPEERALVTAEFLPVTAGEAELAAKIDVVLGATPVG